jgi:tRNA-2-methylthio-N6-dimethylallyladenosine synthase
LCDKIIIVNRARKGITVLAKKITTIIPKEEIEKQYHFMQSVQSENERIAAAKGKRQAKAFVRTFGCQMNEHDSEKISGMLTSMGYEITDCQEDCDIIVFNTCCVRENAEEKVFGHLGALKGLKRDNPDLIIVVCG